MPTEHPILFNGDMVRAILDGSKTVTRRPVTRLNSTALGYTTKSVWDNLYKWDQAKVDGPGDPMGYGGVYQYLHVPAWNPADGEPPKDDIDCWYRVRPRIISGDRLYVRETWSDEASTTPGESCAPYLRYRATGDTATRWRPSIHMPRWAARIWLEVTDVRVERIQDITQADIEAEGKDLPPTELFPTCNRFDKLRAVWKASWDAIYADKGFGWDANTWVWVISFTPVDA